MAAVNFAVITDGLGGRLLVRANPSPPPPPDTGDDVLSNPVTFALDATGVGNRYDVTDDSEFDAVPFATLGPGDVVNIYHKETPYARKFGLRAQGTESNPVIINGVTDASGNRPVLAFNGSTTAAGCNPSGTANDIFSTTPAFGESLGGIVVKRGPSDSYSDYSPKWITIQNLEMNGGGGAAGRTYTSLANGSQSFGSDAAGIYLLMVEDCIVRNCVVTDCGFGLFVMAKDDLPSQACKRIQLLYNRFSGNGVNGSFLEHGVYFQSMGPNIVEGNYFGGLRSGAQGSAYKTRSSGEVFRYNWVVANARATDFVHSEDSNPGIQSADDYGYVHVYGNVIESLGAAFAIHLGGDNLGEDSTGTPMDPLGDPPYGSPRRYMEQMYFYSNTVVNNYSAFRSAVFDLSLAGAGESPRTRVDAWDNAFLNDAAATAYWAKYVGSVYLRGVNHGQSIAGNARDGANASYYDINTVGTLNTGDAGVEDFEGGDYRPASGSALRNQAAGEPGGLPVSYVSRPVEYMPRVRSNGLIARPTVNDLGAFEHGLI